MHESTAVLFKELNAVKTKEEFMKKLTSLHQEIKDEISKDGLKFYDVGSQLSESIVGGQLIKGSIASKAFLYEELNYIKHGLTIGWYANIDNTDRYSKIQNKTKELFDKLD